MKIGVFGDVHGDLQSLTKVLKHLRAEGVDTLVCLGDLVDGGSQERAVVETIRDQGIPCVRGNHDVCNTADLDPEHQHWLDRLPDELQVGTAFCTHISPRRIRCHKIHNGGEAFNVFDECAHRRIFVGHTHVSLVFGDKGEIATWAREIPFTFGIPHTLDPEERTIVSVGAVAHSRDRQDTARCAIFDDQLDTLTLVSIPR